MNNLQSAMMQNQNPEILLRNARENLAVDERYHRFGPFVLDQAAASSSCSSCPSLSSRILKQGAQGYADETQSRARRTAAGIDAGASR